MRRGTRTLPIDVAKATVKAWLAGVAGEAEGGEAPAKVATITSTKCAQKSY